MSCQPSTRMESRCAPIAAKISRTLTPGSGPPAIAPITKQTAAPKIAPSICRLRMPPGYPQVFSPPPFGGIGSSKQPQCPEPPRMAQRNVPQTRMVGISLSSASSLRWLSTWPNGSSRSWGSPWQGVSREYLILYGQNAYFASSHQAIKTRRSIENSVIQVDRLGCCDLHILSARVGADREIA